MEVKNSTIVITGASSGIGEATAIEAARRGAKVVILLARNDDRLQQAAAKVAEAGATPKTYVVDLSDIDAIKATAAKIQSEAGAPDILINNAGAGNWLSLQETPVDAIPQMIAVPTVATMVVTKLFLDEMVDNNRGAIANITSPAAYLDIPGASVYSVARAAIKKFSDQLRLELANTKVTVSTVCLGKTATAYFSKHPGTEERIPNLGSLAPTLSVQQAASIVLDAVEKGKKNVVAPFTIRLLTSMTTSPLHSLVQWVVTRFFGWRPPQWGDCPQQKKTLSL